MRLRSKVHITNISEAKANLSRLIDRVMRGEEVVIGKAGKPVAKLVPFDLDTRPRDLEQGIWKGKVQMAADFDELPDEVLRLFTGEAGDEPTP